MPSFAIAPYLAPYAPTLRPLAYYLTWAAYYCSYALSPGLVTLLQLVALVLTHGLPPLERWTERARARMRGSEWAEERWAWPGGRPPTEYPPWLLSALRACDVRWVFVDAWKWVVEKLRALSTSMGWKPTAGPAAVTARSAPRPVPAHRAPSLPSHPLSTQSSPFPPHPATPPSAFSASPRSVRSNPFSHPPAPSPAASLAQPRPPSLRSRFSAPLPVRHGSLSGLHGGAGARGSRFEGGRVAPLERDPAMAATRAESVHSRMSNPFSAAHSAVEVEDDDERGSVWSGKEWKKA